jgi:hypothetical protein
MQFKIGDRVRFLNEKGEGVVSRIINKTTLGVTIEDGFEIPYTVSQLFKITETTETVQSIDPAPIQEPAIKKTLVNSTERKEQEGIYIAFSPENINDITHSDINVWISNYTSYRILFTYSVKVPNGFKTIETGTLNAFEHSLIETIDRKLLSDNSNFKIDVLFFDQYEHKYQLPVSGIIKLKPIKLYKENAFESNDLISEKALVMNVAAINNGEEEIDLSNIDVSKLLSQKKNYVDLIKKSKPHVANNPAYEMEIDLHIEELIDRHAGMSNGEIIQIQLKYFQKALDQAIAERYRKLIVIHGVGTGRLKEEVRIILSSYNNLRFHDGSYSKYGFGATEVLIN